MKTRLLFLLLFALALLIGCSSDDDNPASSSTEQFGKNTELLGFWKMIDEEDWECLPISFGDEFCLYIDENGLNQYTWTTSNFGALILERTNSSIAEDSIRFEYVLNEASLQLFSDSDTLNYERPVVETTVIDSLVITYSVPTGVASLILINPEEILEVLAENSQAGYHSHTWYPEQSLENGFYAFDLYREIGDTIRTMCRKYVEVSR